MADTSTILVYCFLNVAVNLMPSRGISLSGIPTVNYGTRQKLTCYDGGWGGISDATFYQNGTKFAVVGRGSWFRCQLQRLKPSLNEYDFNKDCDWNRRTLIIKKVDNEYNNTVWHCTTRRDTSNKFSFKVEDLSTCSLNASISGTISDVVEGTDLNLTCDTNTTEKDLICSMSIYYNNGSFIATGMKTIYKPASRGDTGTYNCQIKKKGENCMSEAQIDINVQYHPTASIRSESNSSINLTCIGNGFPDNFTFYGWHHSINGQLVRILKGNETRGSSILIVDKVTALDNGNYVCLLSNGISDKDGNLNPSAEYSIKLPATPFAIENEIQDIDIKTGDNVSMTSVFLTEDVISVTLLSPGETQKKLNVTDVIQEEYKYIGWYGSTVNVSVIVVQYFIQNVTNNGHYYFNVCNVYELCHDSVGLMVKFSTEEPHSGINVSDKQEQEQNLPIILGTVAAVIIVIVIIVICVVAARRRASSSKIINDNDHYKAMYSQSNPAYGDRNVEIIPNDLYHASEPQNNRMEIIPNDLYVPSEPIPDTDHKNIEIIPNELYVSADVDNQSGNQNASGLDTTPGELYVGGETIKRNKEIQKHKKSRYPDQEQVYMNDPMSK